MKNRRGHLAEHGREGGRLGLLDGPPENGFFDVDRMGYQAPRDPANGSPTAVGLSQERFSAHVFPQAMRVQEA